MEHYPKSLTAAAVLRKLLSREPVELAAQPLPSLATALAAFVARAPAASTPLALLLAGEAASLTRNVAGSRPSDKRKPEKYIYYSVAPAETMELALHPLQYSTCCRHHHSHRVLVNSVLLECAVADHIRALVSFDIRRYNC